MKLERARHIGIVAVSAEGAALCYRTICVEGATVLGPHDHPQVTMHTYSLADYMRLVETEGWHEAGLLMLESAALLERAGAELLVCPTTQCTRRSTWFVNGRRCRGFILLKRSLSSPQAAASSASACSAHGY